MSTTRTYTKAEVSRHNLKTDLWITIHGRVYDVTKYNEDHPGGIDALVEVAGQDATNAYEDVGHSEDSREVLAQFLVGDLEGALPTSSRPAQAVKEAQKSQSQPLIGAKPPTHELHELLSNPHVVQLSTAALVGAAALLGYEGYAHWPSSGQKSVARGGFWKGAMITGAASVSIAIVLSWYLEKALRISKDFSAYPTHMKFKTAPVTPVYGVLNPREYKKFPLVKKVQLSPNVYRLVFKLPEKSSVLGLPIGQHVAIRADIDGKSVSRSYTPVSNNRDRGTLELCIKIYPDGQLTGQYLVKLNVGDEVEFRGPKGMMRYRKGMAGRIGMIAGGTGITPMYQLIRAICEDSSDQTSVSLLYANNTEEDILLRDVLDGWARRFPQKFQVQYVLGKPPKNWKGQMGFVNKEMAQAHLPAAAADSKIMLCGPPGMVNAAKKFLVEMGFDAPSAVSKMNDQVFCF